MMVLFVIASIVGIGSFALAMRRHQERLFSRSFSSHIGQLLRFCGVCALAISLRLAAEIWGQGVGIVAWIGLALPITVLTALLLAYLPRPIFATKRNL